jgi:hypothetical protein
MTASMWGHLIPIFPYGTRFGCIDHSTIQRSMLRILRKNVRESIGQSTIGGVKTQCKGSE